MASEQSAVSLDDRASRFWMTVSASGGLIVAACLAAIRRRTAAKPVSVGSMSADWLRRHEYAAGRQGQDG